MNKHIPMANQRQDLDWKLYTKTFFTHFLKAFIVQRTQIHSKSFKKPLLMQKDDYTPQVKVIRRLFIIDLHTQLAIFKQ